MILKVRTLQLHECMLKFARDETSFFEQVTTLHFVELLQRSSAWCVKPVCIINIVVVAVHNPSREVAPWQI